MRKLAFLFLLVPFVALWVYGCDENPGEPQTATAAGLQDAATPSFAKDKPDNPKPELPSDCTDGQSIIWDARSSSFVCGGDISFWYRSGTVPAHSIVPDITGCYDRRMGGGYWVDPGVHVNVMAPETSRSPYNEDELEGPLNAINVYYEFENPTDESLTYTLYVICMDDPR